MRASMLAPAARRRPGRGLPYLVMSGVLWGTGGLTGILLSQVTGLSALLALLEPLTGTILAALVLGQHLSASGIVGAAVLALAVIVTIFDADRGAGLIPRPG
jgi:drug/metabolite transporter (DMT)-like permease